MREMMWMVVMVILGEPPERGHAAQGTNSTAVPTEGMSPAEGTALPAATAPHGRAGLARSPAPPTAVPGRCARIGGAPGLGSTPAGAVGGADPIGPARPSATLRALRSAAMAAAPAGRAGLGWDWGRWRRWVGGLRGRAALTGLSPSPHRSGDPAAVAAHRQEGGGCGDAVPLPCPGRSFRSWVRAQRRAVPPSGNGNSAVRPCAAPGGGVGGRPFPAWDTLRRPGVPRRTESIPGRGLSLQAGCAGRWVRAVFCS